MIFDKKSAKTIEELQKTIVALQKQVSDLQKQVDKLQAKYDFDKYCEKHPTAISTQTNMYDGIPNCCRHCSNHPINGGSGICHCTLPNFENPTISWCSNTDTNIWGND